MWEGNRSEIISCGEDVLGVCTGMRKLPHTFKTLHAGFISDAERVHIFKVICVFFHIQKEFLLKILPIKFN